MTNYGSTPSKRFEVSLLVALYSALYCSTVTIRPDTSRRQQIQLPHGPLVVASVPLKPSSRNGKFCHRVPFSKEKMPWTLALSKNEAYRPGQVGLDHLPTTHLFPPVALSLMCRAVMPSSLQRAATSWAANMAAYGEASSRSALTFIPPVTREMVSL